jgi:hypothetical protein
MTAPATGPQSHGDQSPRTDQVSTRTGAQAVIANAVDPARRPDVLFRVRRVEGQQVSAWWLIGGFVAFSAAVIGLLSFMPGG